MNPSKDKTDFPRPDRKTTAQGAPPHERAAEGSPRDKVADDRAHGFSQDSGYPASGGSEAEVRKQHAEAHKGEILPVGPHDNQPGSTVPNLNSASVEEIAKADFVGQSFASAIVSLRESLGSFERWDQLRQIEGLKPNKIAELQRTFRLGPTH